MPCRRARSIGRRSLDRSRRPRPRPERARRVHAWNGYNFEDSILLSERIVRDERLSPRSTSRSSRSWPHTKLGPEGDTRDSPNVFGRGPERGLDEAGIVYIGAEVAPATSLVGKNHPKGESPMTRRRALTRHLREKASDVRDTRSGFRRAFTGPSSRCASSIATGVEKDERAMAIERERSSVSPRTATNEQAILDRNVYGRLADQP